MNVLTTEEIEKRISDSYELPNNVLDAVPEPLVTIRTSTYNHGPYIRQCIEGVLMQKTNFPFELIIGEDYSTDETRDIVFEYAKKYPDIIRVITADYNVGSKANGRRCIRACRGKYIAICEGDDYWIDPYKLQKQVDFLELHPSYSLVCCNFLKYDQDLGLFYERNKQKFPQNIREAFTFTNDYPNTWLTQPLTCLYRKDFSEKINLEVYQYARDVHFFYSLLKIGNGYFINQNVGVYRLHEGGVYSKVSIVSKKISAFNMYRELYLHNYDHYSKSKYLIAIWDLLMLSILRKIEFEKYKECVISDFGKFGYWKILLSLPIGYICKYYKIYCVEPFFLFRKMVKC